MPPETSARQQPARGARRPPPAHTPPAHAARDRPVRARALACARCAQTNQIDYFSQTVDYMAMTIQLRKSWQLSRDEQSRFDGFDFISSSMIEQELSEPPADGHASLGPLDTR